MIRWVEFSSHISEVLTFVIGVVWYSGLDILKGFEKSLSVDNTPKSSSLITAFTETVH